ncbi:MAG: hypothetical protein K1060chlam2_00046 [Chlamydiae bacterium]|nr:hypothetical protein [Chlamydiota bacterium]
MTGIAERVTDAVIDHPIVVESLLIGAASLSIALICKVTRISKTLLFKHALISGAIDSATFGSVVYLSLKCQDRYKITDKRKRTAIHTIVISLWLTSRFIIAKVFNRRFGANFTRRYMLLNTLGILAPAATFGVFVPTFPANILFDPEKKKETFVDHVFKIGQLFVDPEGLHY